MSEILQGLLKLNGKISSKNSDSFIYDLNISKENISFLRLIYEDELVEAYRNVSGQLVNVENLENLIGQVISIEFVTAQLKKPVITSLRTTSSFQIDSKSLPFIT